MRIIPFSEQEKRMKRWKKRHPLTDSSLLMFLAKQHEAYRRRGYDYRGFLTGQLAKGIHDDDRFEYLLIETGLFTASTNKPVYDIYRREKPYPKLQV